MKIATIATALGLLLVARINLSASGLTATGTFTDSLISPGDYQYDITINNTGGTTIGTFWFSWIPCCGFLTAAPTNIQSPSGWADVTTNTNMAILWTDNGALLPGASQSGFIFDSTLTPAQLEGPSSTPGDPVATSFVYIAAPFGDPGFQFVVTPASTASVPEPATIALAALGLGLAACCSTLRRR